MSEVAKLVTDALQSLLIEQCTSERLRLAEKPENAAAIEQLWSAINALGFADMYLPEEQGGAGLTLSELYGIVFLFGYYLLPLPLADTLISRGLLQQSNQPIPEGMIVLASALATPGDRVAQGLTVSCLFADRASSALVQVGDQWLLSNLQRQAVTKKAGDRSALASFSLKEAVPIAMNSDLPSLQVVSASLRAAEMAGMIAKMLELSVAYANERSQFGKAIGQFQAIQQPLAVLAEESAAARMASCLAFGGHQFSSIAGATAKMRAGTAATKAAAIAHAVHGAIGVSEEYDLQLYSRRLIEMRFVAGSESFWAEQIGRQRLGSSVNTSLEFVRAKFDSNT